MFDVSVDGTFLIGKQSTKSIINLNYLGKNYNIDNVLSDNDYDFIRLIY
jgi:hypothetical protein